MGVIVLSSSGWYHISLKVQKGILGVLAIAPDAGINNEQKHLMEAFANIIALALSNSIDRKRKSPDRNS
jgi:K+-sensing histidine kinase KdpD